jgi:aryl-alcohol dehydrogenase-like predicted oxidoreductase
MCIQCRPASYSIEGREAEKSILSLAAKIKASVLAAEPYGSGKLFRAVQGRELPNWVRTFANSWGQFFLKYLLADPRVTAVIPRTSNPVHMADNAGACGGPCPTPNSVCEWSG